MASETKLTCPECGETELIDRWEDPEGEGYQCLKMNCLSFGVFGEYE